MVDDFLAEARALADAGGPDPTWTADALCAQTIPDVTVPADSTELWLAQRSCALCHMHLECAADGITTARDGVDPGVRAGLTGKQIRRAAGTGRTTSTGKVASRHIRARVVALAAEGQPAATLAAQFGVSERTAMRWIRAGKAA